MMRKILEVVIFQVVTEFGSETGLFSRILRMDKLFSFSKVVKR